MGFEDPRLKKFVALRMNYKLFNKLKELSKKNGKDISSTIRELCKEGLSKENNPELVQS